MKVSKLLVTKLYSIVLHRQNVLTTTSRFTQKILQSPQSSFPYSHQSRLFSSSTSSSSSISNNNMIQNNNDQTRLFPEELNILYDSKCNVCNLEINFMAKRDARLHPNAPKLKMTDLESDNYDENSPVNGFVSYKKGMGAMHGIKSDGTVMAGVKVFHEAYKHVGLGWLYVLTDLPIIKQLANWAYKFFCKYRCNITRGSSLESLIQAYEEKKALQQHQQQAIEDCQECKDIKEKNKDRMNE